MTKNNVLNALFGSRTRAKLLGWFFTHTDEKYYVRQVAPIIQEDPTNASREMARLESFGILVSARRGNLKQFKANKNCSFFNELKGLLQKTVGISGQMEAVIREIPDIELAFIYGSFAKGSERADSDVDLFIVGDVDLDIIDAVLQDTGKVYGRTINYIAYDLKEFKEKLAAGDGFIIDVINGEKIALKGDAEDIRVFEERAGEPLVSYDEMAKRALRPVHPGEVLLKEFLKPMSVSQNRLALSLGVPPRRINEIVLGKRSISADMALRLAKFFDMSAEFWLGLQAQHDLDVTAEALGGRLDREVKTKT